LLVRISTEIGSGRFDAGRHVSCDFREHRVLSARPASCRCWRVSVIFGVEKCFIAVGPTETADRTSYI